MVDLLGYHIAEHRVSKELESLVGFQRQVRVLVEIRTMDQRLLKESLVSELYAQSSLEVTEISQDYKDPIGFRAYDTSACSTCQGKPRVAEFVLALSRAPAGSAFGPVVGGALSGIGEGRQVDAGMGSSRSAMTIDNAANNCYNANT